MNTHCSIALLESALAGNLPADDEAALHRHLEECEQCGAALERMAGGAAWCQEAASLLTRDELDAAVPTSDEWSAVDFTVEHLEPADEPNVLGRLGGYDVLEIIGHGGMGVVLKAFDRELKRYVAIKVLAPHLAQSSLAKKRFAREAQAAAAIVHPNVLAIHQVQPNGRLPFLVMPLVAGESLAQRLTAQGTLELKETLRIGMQAAAGLAAAHEQGLVHRDVKPANILLEKGVERAVLTDFGLARAADDVTMTRWGIIAGTPQYMSPEQARGEPLDGRSDLFSLGCVLYEMATGVSPFRTESMMATMRRLVDDSPQAMASLNPELPPWFIAIVERLLEKDPSRRFGSAKEVSELLEGCLAHVQQPNSVPLPAAVPKPAPRRAWRPPVIRLKGALAMIAALGVGLFGTFLLSAAPPDIAGQWSGEDWGQVVLKKTDDAEYTGTYSDTVGKQPGEIQLKWSRIERRFNGTWREGEDRFGELSVRLVGDEIHGALTTDPKSKINPATPRLADLTWTRVAAKPATRNSHAKAPLARAVMATGSLDATTSEPVTKWVCRAPVDEADIAAVEVGQEVRLTVDAFPKRTFQGKVAQIGKTPVAAQNAVLHETVIDIADPDPRFKVGMTANVTFIVAPKPAAPVAFGPVIERVVNLIGDKSIGDNCLLDLDRGTFLAPPPEMQAKWKKWGDWPSALADGLREGGDIPEWELTTEYTDSMFELEKWAAKNGGDLLAGEGEPRGLVLLPGGAGEYVDSTAGYIWHTPATELLKRFELLKPNTFYRWRMKATSGLNDLHPDSFLFKTREGGMGILQILGFTDKPRGVKIRYKLVQGGETKNATGQNLSFGPVVNGLQAAVELKPASGTFTMGEPIGGSFHIRNSSPNSVFVAGASWRDSDGLTIEDEQGRKVSVHRILSAGETLIQRVFVQPGDTAVFNSGGLAFLAEDANDKGVTSPVGYYVKVKPGKFTIRFGLHFPDMEEPGEPNPHDWRGDLETGPVTVDVKPAKTSAIPPAAQPLSFGPVMERVLPNGVPCMEQYFQFHSGEVFIVGNGPATTKQELEKDWKKVEDAGGVDMTAGSNEEYIVINGEGCIFTQDFDGLNWEKTTAEEVVERMKHVNDISGTVEPRTKDFPITYRLA